MSARQGWQGWGQCCKDTAARARAAEPADRPPSPGGTMSPGGGSAPGGSAPKRTSRYTSKGKNERRTGNSGGKEGKFQEIPSLGSKRQLLSAKQTRAKCGRRLSRFPQTARFHHPSRGGNQLQTYPQADEELLLAARHHAAVVEHWADLLQGLGSKRRGLVAEDVNLSALQPRVRENMAGLDPFLTFLTHTACLSPRRISTHL